MNRNFLTLFFTFLSLISFSQDFTLSGVITDNNTGEKLIGVSVIDSESKKGTSTNENGYYSLTLKKGEYDIKYSFIGLESVSKKIVLNKNKKINISLKTSSEKIDEIHIRGESTKNIESSKVSQISIEAKQIKALPAIMGEVDILKTIQLLPGVSSGGEGNTGFYVRGGGPDQNLIMLDDATIYNASHLFGFFSVFPADAVKDINLIKGGMPAEFGGRLSSVLDISLKDGNPNKYNVEGGIGIISSKIMVEGPIIKNKTSFILSGRRTYADILAQKLFPEKVGNNGYYFYDFTGKVNHKFSDKDKLSFSFYKGDDIASFSAPSGNFAINVPWGNTLGILKWNHVFNEKLVMKNSAIYTDYSFEMGAEMQDIEFKLSSEVRDISYKTDFTFLPNVQHKIKFGGITTYHTFSPATVTGSAGDVSFDPDEIFEQFANESALYISDDYEVNERLKVNIGGRLTYFQQTKDYKTSDIFTSYLQDMIKEGDSTKYINFEPRISARFKLNPTSSLKSSYSENYQYIHLASMGGMSLPTDLWLPSSNKIKPKFAKQFTLGYFKNLENNMWETSIEGYYKEMENLVEYKEGAVPDDNANGSQDQLLTQGNGDSYGVELFVKKVFGETTGWIGYTHSYTNRVFEEINDGEEFPAKYDRRHDLSVVLSHEFNKKLTLSSVFVYASGSRLTLPTERYILNNNIYTEFTSKNGYKMEDYHRMDVSLIYTPKPHKKFQSSWNLSVYNLYNRKNPYFVYFDMQGEEGSSLETGGLTPVAMQMSLFPIIPSISWNFKF